VFLNAYSFSDNGEMGS